MTLVEVLCKVLYNTLEVLYNILEVLYNMNQPSRIRVQMVDNNLRLLGCQVASFPSALWLYCPVLRAVTLLPCARLGRGFVAQCSALRWLRCPLVGAALLRSVSAAVALISSARRRVCIAVASNEPSMSCARRCCGSLPGAWCCSCCIKLGAAVAVLPLVLRWLRCPVLGAAVA